MEELSKAQVSGNYQETGLTSKRDACLEELKKQLIPTGNDQHPLDKLLKDGNVKWKLLKEQVPSDPNLLKENMYLEP
jgi:hypothetical protein